MLNLVQNRNLTNIFYIMLILLLLSWVSIASVRTVINTVKIFTEERQLIFLTEDQKREIIYGDVSILYTKIDTITTKESNIFLFSQDAKAFFVLRYLLYPKKIYWVKDIEKVHKITINDYILIYHQTELNDKKKFLYIDTFKTNNSASYLYKIL